MPLHESVNPGEHHILFRLCRDVGDHREALSVNEMAETLLDFPLQKGEGALGGNTVVEGTDFTVAFLPENGLECHVLEDATVVVAQGLCQYSYLHLPARDFGHNPRMDVTDTKI